VPGREVKPPRHPSVPNDKHHCTAGRLLCTAGRRLPNTATAAPSAVVFGHPSTNRTGAQGGTRECPAASLLNLQIYKIKGLFSELHTLPSIFFLSFYHTLSQIEKL
jgi:hypothetical protein